MLSLEAALPEGEETIKIPVADPFAEMGMTRIRINEIKEALSNEQTSN